MEAVYSFVGQNGGKGMEKTVKKVSRIADPAIWRRSNPVSFSRFTAPKHEDPWKNFLVDKGGCY